MLKSTAKSLLKIAAEAAASTRGQHLANRIEKKLQPPEKEAPTAKEEK